MSRDLGFTHVEFLPITEHPFDGSWGYQPTGLFAPTSRFGTPADFAALVDACHRAGLGVILDWVPGHFPDDPHGLARFDGTALYEHADPRQGRHLDWDTLIYNFGRTEVANFLLASALFWLDRYGVDGLRVDAVASMLYLDYSRPAGGWIPNKHGGRENLDAIGFLRRFNTEVFGRYPEATTAAEESTAWPMVSRPVDMGGLGFGYKWNMGWMHDTLDYISKDPIYRRHHHGQILFGLHYAFSENFILPLSHDEVVHGKRSILGRMPGDDWQRFANLRAYYGFMFGHPGKKLLFMGCEFGQESEWRHDHSLDWHLLDQPLHRGRAGAGARPQPALSRRAGVARARLRGRRLRMAGDARCRPQRVRLAAQGTRDARALPGGREFHARGLSRLSHQGAVRRRLARSAQHRCGASMAAAMSGTAGAVKTLEQGADPRGQPCHSAAGRSFSRPGALSVRLSAGAAASARRDLGRPRHQLRAVLRQRRPRSSSACSTARAGASSSASRCPSAPRTSGTAIWPTSRRASSTATACTDLIEPERRLPLQSAQAAARSLCQASWPDGWSGAMRISATAPTARGPTSRSTAATMRAACRKAVVVDEAFTWGGERRPRSPWEDTIIYEAHVKGLTQLREDVPPHWRGTFRGLAAPAVIDHLKRLGVTTLELLPIHAFVDERHLVEHGLVNYWGYNTLGFFAPEQRYAREPPLDAFRSTVSRLHDAGIEVILDVVYNHTAEGNHLGPTLSFRGIDNTSYYWLLPDAAALLRRTSPAAAMRSISRIRACCRW